MELILSQALEVVDWPELAALFECALLGTRDPEQLRRAFRKSYRVCFAYDGARLVGCGRVLSDGEFYAAVYDVAVLPEYQGKGIGTELMANLIEDLPRGPVILFATPGKERFYQRLGFHRLKTGMGLFRHPEGARKRGYIE